jgi:hypothetical protein
MYKGKPHSVSSVLTGLRYSESLNVTHLDHTVSSDTRYIVGLTNKVAGCVAPYISGERTLIPGPGNTATEHRGCCVFGISGSIPSVMDFFRYPGG